MYTTLDGMRTGQYTYTKAEIIKNVLDNNPAASFIEDLKSAGKFNGIAILSTAGKILGVTGAVISLNNLYEDATDGDGKVSMANILDAGISVGSLFIKSNIVGAAVSRGWLLIKGEFE